MEIEKREDKGTWTCLREETLTNIATEDSAGMLVKSLVWLQVN